MADDLKARLERISNKAMLLTELYVALRKEKEDADYRIEELNNIVNDQQKEIERLTQEVEYLKIATTIVPDRTQDRKSVV